MQGTKWSTGHVCRYLWKFLRSFISALLLGHTIARLRLKYYVKNRDSNELGLWESEFRKQKNIRDDIVCFAFRELRECLGIEPTKLRVSDQFDKLGFGICGRCHVGDLLFSVPCFLWERYRIKLDEKDCNDIVTVGDYIILLNRVIPLENSR